ncbi:DUF1653 domain-containing protein [Candidatus Woesearchaeota archaeon]|nr:DUF1653 domain-containing protein [Candidatus Woesearchaeota archaeon]
MTGKIHQINTGSGGVPKLPVPEAYVSLERVIGDEWSWGIDRIQSSGKPGKHGGSQKAVCLYSLECLEELKKSGFPVFPGALGENLTTEGLDYHTIRIGDVYQVGADVRLRISAIRTPCTTIADAYGAGIIKAMFDQRVAKCDYTSPRWGLTGFYAEVFRQGVVRRDDPIEKIFAGDPDIPLGKWRHYRGNEYDVLDIALDTETEQPEPVVIYRAREDSEFGPRRVWVRSRNDFLTTVRTKDGDVPRFTFLG